MSSEAIRRVRVALHRHEMVAPDTTCERLASLVLAANVGPEGVAEALDRDGVAHAGEPATRLAAADIVAALIEGRVQ